MGRGRGGSHVQNLGMLVSRRGRRRREGEGKYQRGKRVSVTGSVREGSFLLSPQYPRGHFVPFPPFLRPATQARMLVVSRFS